MRPVIDIFRTRGGIPNQFDFNQVLIAAAPITTAMRNNRVFAQQVMAALGLPASWLGQGGTITDSARQRQFYQKLYDYIQYAHPGGTDPGTNEDDWMIDAPTMKHQLLNDDKFRVRFLQKANQALGMQLNMAQFMAILNSSSGVWEQMYERLRSMLGTGGTKPPVGGLGG
jgi:hypothetical protein